MPIKTANPTEVEGLTGTLVGPSGKPVVGAWVKVYAAPGSSLAKVGATGLVAGPALDSIQTSLGGVFEMKNLAEGTYNLAASVKRNDSSLALFLKGLVVTRRTDLGVDTMKLTGNLRIPLASGSDVVSGALCGVAASPYSATSDTSGACVLNDLPPGVYQVTITHPLYEVKVTGNLSVLSGILNHAGTIPLFSNLTPIPAGQHFALTGNTVALWTFNSIVDGKFPDATLGGHDLPAPNGASLTNSPYGSAAGFSNDGAQRVDTTLTLAGNALLTYEARVRLENYPSSSLWNGSASPVGNYSGLRMLIRYDGRIQVVGQSGTPGNWNWYNGITQAGVVPLKKWVNLAIAADRENRRLYAYVDGVQQALYYGPPLPMIGTLRGEPGEPFTVGNDAFDPQPFPGLIDEIRVSNKLVFGRGVDMIPATDPLDASLPALPPSTPTTPTGSTVLIASQDANLVGAAPSSSSIGTHANLNFGKTDYFAVGVYDISTVARGVVRFKIPSQTRGANITKAVIRIYSSRWIDKNVSTATITISARRLLRDWKEGSGSNRDGTGNSATVDGITAVERYWGTQNGAEDWNQRLVAFDGVDAAVDPTATATKSNGYIGAWDFDVTELAKSWANDSSKNFGVIFSSPLPSSNALAEDYPEFYTKEANMSDAFKPQLILTTVAPDTTPTSAPGVATWSAGSSGTTQPLYAVTWNDSLNLFAAVGKSGTLRTSPDGSVWTERTSGTTKNLLAVHSRGNVIVAVGDSGTVLRSTDGITWSARNSSTSSGLYAVAANSERFVAMGQNGSSVHSTDGLNWTPASSGTVSIYSVAAEADTFVATGANGLALSSPDGLVWKTIYTPPTGTTVTLYSVARGGGGRMAVGGAGTILTFSDSARTWTSRASGTTQALYAQSSYGGNQRVVVGGGGILVTSSNGVSWTSRSSGTTQTLYGIVRNATRYVAVGAAGTVVISGTATLVQ